MRVIYNSISSGSSKFIAIPLDAVAYAGLATRSHPVLLFFSAFAGFVAFFGRDLTDAQAIVSGMVAVALIVAYFATRRAIITICSNSAEKISLPTQGMERESIVSFLNSILETRHNYLQSIRGENVS